jgi:hypothetical protein
VAQRFLTLSAMSTGVGVLLKSKPRTETLVPSTKPLRPLRATSGKMIVDIHAASPNWAKPPCMAVRIVWKCVLSAVGFCAPCLARSPERPLIAV